MMLPSRPGAGASTGLIWLAHRLALVDHVPTLVLEQGGNAAYEAIERLYTHVGRSLLVVADPQDVSTDDLQGLATRCAPQRYPVLFLTSRRVFRNASSSDLPMMDVVLSDREKVDLLAQIGRHCPDVALSRLLTSSTRSTELGRQISAVSTTTRHQCSWTWHLLRTSSVVSGSNPLPTIPTL